MTPEEVQRKRAVLTRLIKARTAADTLLEYSRITMPDYSDPSDNPRSRYFTGRHHELMARKLEALEQGTIKRLILNLGPRNGKTQLASKDFISWYSGRNPDKSVVFGTYNENFAGDIGRAVRDKIRGPEHALVFPTHTLKDGSEASQRLETYLGGQLSFVGRGGTITGRGGHLIVIDDPIKDRVEADSKLTRDKLWTWFTQVIMTRQMSDDAAVILIQTRWHEDDLVGRLTDPTNHFYDEEEAKQWDVIDLPALAFDDGTVDPLGRKPGEALWPERFPVKFLRAQQRLDPRGFQALYQGRPSAGQGVFFMAQHLKTYRQDELPKNLRFYAASDHAVSALQSRDRTALIMVGVDEDDNVFVLPSSEWGQFPADDAVARMIRLMQMHKPLYWWAERGQITKSIGPFLRKRMQEEQTYTPLIEVTPTADKQTRAQSIQARVATGKVYFPVFAHWWPDAKDQMLKFPNGAHDDFVDALAYIGLGLAQQRSASPARETPTFSGKGTFREMFASIRAQENENRRRAKNAGW